MDWEKDKWDFVLKYVCISMPALNIERGCALNYLSSKQQRCDLRLTDDKQLMIPPRTSTEDSLTVRTIFKMHSWFIFHILFQQKQSEY